MSEPYLGEIRLFGFSQVPRNWIACNGSLLPINQYQALFAVLGTTYGGNGSTNFGVPDLRGRVPISQGAAAGLTTRVLGKPGGEQSHALQTSEIPAHGHALNSTTTAGTTATPATTVHLATSNLATSEFYAPQASVPSYNLMAQTSIASSGNSLPHNNMMPSLTCNYCMCTSGVYPSAQ